MEPERMTVDVMARLLDRAYNDVTFKNALVCCLDWCNYMHCVNIHKNVRIGVNSQGEIVNQFERVSTSGLFQLTTDTVKIDGKEYFERVKVDGKWTYVRVLSTGGENPQEEGWYEYINPSEEGYYEKYSKEYIYTPVSHTTADNPTINGWYEAFEDSGGNIYYELSTDPVALDLKTYYKCTEQKKTYYLPSQDTIVQPNKKYYQQKNVSEWKDLPDFTNHYVKNIDITVPGVDEEVTLVNKRPVV